VRGYMTAMGIAETRLVAHGYGTLQPLEDPTGLKGAKLKAARAKNRRVEFQLIIATPPGPPTPAPAQPPTPAPSP
jgi:outer membrane protein OmpA-like peptidoglycan-associated protein